MQIKGNGGILGQKFSSSASLNITLSTEEEKIHSFWGLMSHNYNLFFARVTLNTEKSMMNGET